ncbi:MAG: hypothetical protein ABSA65_14950 [Acidimicrobiales bacterium]
MAIPWIQETTNYHSIEPGRDEYHDGGWICFEGKKIKAEHLVNGKGGRVKKCAECAKQEKR